VANEGVEAAEGVCVEKGEDERVYSADEDACEIVRTGDDV